MRWGRRQVGFAVLSVLFLLLTATGGVTGVSSTTDVVASTTETTTVDARPSTVSAPRTLALTKEVHLTPERPGEITVTARYDTPSNLAALRVELPGDGTATATRGFTERDGRFVWDERTRTPTITYRLSVNETKEATGPIAGDGDYIFVDVGPWALARTPQVATEWSWTGPDEVSITKSTTVAGSGAVGDEVVYLGEFEEYRRTAHGQTFRLVVPAQAALAEQPSDVLDAVAETADAMRVGDRDPRVFMVAAPTDSVEWAVNGLQTGESDLWVRDRSRLDTAANVWVHEYVHTRQDHALTAEARWFTEASATYYAALFALEGGHVDYQAFRTRLAVGERQTHAEAILANPSTWDGVAPYTKGALVAGELDRQTRLATTGNSLQTVFRRMNAHDGQVTQSDLRGIVRTAGGAHVAGLLDEYTTTTATPSMWGRNDHVRAFDTRLPDIEYGFDDRPNTSAFRVTGPYRTGTIDAARPIQLATGETLTATVLISNTGTAAGEYEARASVNGGTVARRNGTLAANETTRWPVSHAFTDPGEYVLSVGAATVELVVRPPATPTVERLSNDPVNPVAGDTITLTATLTNDDSLPAAANLALSENGTPVETRHVVLGPDENRTLAFERTPKSAGTYRYRLGNRTLTVSVSEPQARVSEGSGARNGSRSPTGTAGSGPGFGIVLTVLVLALAGVTVGRRR